MQTLMKQAPSVESLEHLGLVEILVPPVLHVQRLVILIESLLLLPIVRNYQQRSYDMTLFIFFVFMRATAESLASRRERYQSRYTGRVDRPRHSFTNDTGSTYRSSETRSSGSRTRDSHRKSSKRKSESFSFFNMSSL